jgi:hypothetical protein
MRAIGTYAFGILLAGCIFYGLATIFGAGPQALLLMDRLADPALDLGWTILSGLWGLIMRGAS